MSGADEGAPGLGEDVAGPGPEEGVPGWGPGWGPGENPAARPCQRPGCAGGYEDFGDGELYCDTCGLAPVVSPRGLIGSTATEVTGVAARQDSASSGASARSRHSRRSVSGRLSRDEAGVPGGQGQALSVRSSGTGGSGRSRLGAGLVKMPGVPRPDPLSDVLENPEVPERKRFCGNSDCGAPVGRARGGHPGRTEGFCTRCGHPYSFVPKLQPGDLVAGQYEVAGCLAHGGLGWIYLAIDRNVSDRWVVLKGLLDTGDEDAMAAAISERRFLAEIEHPSIVRIYNFVERLDARTGSMDGYIVMEYVGGKSLKEIANARRTPDNRRDPLPVEQACAYGIEVLDALGYLHSRNLLYCDFKVDNAIQQDDRLKLIDMGAVRRMDDHESAIYGTVGYQAPEVAELGPSVASDLYTVARTLAVLTFDFQGYTTVFADSLPEPEHVEVFRRYESFYRLLVRATDPDPWRRFASAQEMAEQLMGVLREVVAMRTGQPRPALSPLFGSEVRVVDTELVPRRRGPVSLLGAREPGRLRLLPSAGRRRGAAVPRRLGPGAATASRVPASSAAAVSSREPGAAAAGPGVSVEAPPVPSAPPAPGGPPQPAAPPFPAAPQTVPPDVRQVALALPVPRVDPADPNAGFLAGLVATTPADLLTALRSAPADSVELRVRELRAHLETPGEEAAAAARAAADALGDRHGSDWRVVWYRGLAALAGEDWETAAHAFDAVYDAFPGELAPKLALAVCAEVLGQLDNAADYYELVWVTDPSHVSAGFGLARVRLAAGDRGGAVAALESVPETSAHWTAARVAAVRARLRQRSPEDDLLPDLLAAGAQVSSLRAAGLEPSLAERLSCEVLGSALDWVLSHPAGQFQQQTETRPQLLGAPLDETGIREGLERSFRRLARLAQTSSERTELVEAANRFRPRTWV
ncbi:tetratricopeptide repeat protein [Streptomyces sp. DSM 44917]|uniref:non-specific serine/threonine protein kinase n=1 Tax=Streptomyces boetiae TaxID=3075541 RepID=A0ABU2L4D9_9ACTN|nr:tetratricopeptide repeat protein [Streptomyces sp. DSM 44917]MDT0306423.1 tetratricopeptide repeat protein [Streptomyces sp. DSM 44917]